MDTERRCGRVQVAQEGARPCGETTDHQAPVDGEPGDLGADVLEVGEHRCGVESVGPERETAERFAVQPDTVVLAEPAQHLRVDRRRGIEEEFVVLVTRTARPQLATAQQQRCPDRRGPSAVPTRRGALARPPRDQAEGEVPGTHTAFGGELVDGGPDRPCPAPGRGVGRWFADQAGQPGRPPREERGQPRRMGVGEVKAVGRQIAVAEQGVG